MPLDLALTDAGFNQRTGRYGFSLGADGDVLLDSTQAYAVMSSIAETKGAWWADSSHGSDVGRFKNATRFTPSPTPSQAEASALDALSPLEQIGLISPNPSAVASLVPVRGLVKLELDVSWQTPGGASQTRKF